MRMNIEHGYLSFLIILWNYYHWCNAKLRFDTVELSIIL